MQIKVSRFESLADAQAHARQVIDEAAEAARNRYITPGGGQALEYQSAVEEARAYQAGQPGDYLMLQADVNAGLAADLEAAADLVLTTRAGWEHVGSAIRAIRLAAKRQVNEAATQRAVAEIRNQAVADLSAV